MSKEIKDIKIIIKDKKWILKKEEIRQHDNKCLEAYFTWLGEDDYYVLIDYEKEYKDYIRGAFNIILQDNTGSYLIDSGSATSIKEALKQCLDNLPSKQSFSTAYKNLLNEYFNDFSEERAKYNGNISKDNFFRYVVYDGIEKENESFLNQK